MLDCDLSELPRPHLWDTVISKQPTLSRHTGHQSWTNPKSRCEGVFIVLEIRSEQKNDRRAKFGAATG